MGLAPKSPLLYEGPQHFTAGDKISSGPGVGRLAKHMWFLFLVHSCILFALKLCDGFFPYGKREYKKKSVYIFFAVTACTKKLSHHVSFFVQKN